MIVLANTKYDTTSIQAPLLRNLFKSLQVSLDVLLLFLSLILHNISWMLEEDDLFEKLMLLINAFKHSLILSCTQAKTGVGITAYVDK